MAERDRTSQQAKPGHKSVLDNKEEFLHAEHKGSSEPSHRMSEMAGHENKSAPHQGEQPKTRKNK